MKANLPFRYNIYLKRDRYHVVFDYRDKDNKRHRKWMGTGLPEGCTKKELNSRINELVEEFYKSFLDGSVFEKKYAEPVALVNNGTTLATGYDFTDFLIFWLETYKPSISETTYYGYRESIAIVINYFIEKFPNLKLTDLKALHLQQFYNEKFTGGVTANTIKHYHANIHKALSYAVKMDLVPSNVSDKTERPKVENMKQYFLIRMNYLNLLNFLRVTDLNLL